MANKYSGTQTEKNLEAAFAGESQARNKYTYFASKAKKDGYQQIAALFEETAANERVEASALEEMVFTDSIPYNNQCSKVKQISIAQLIADTIRCVENNESISKQYLI